MAMNLQDEIVEKAAKNLADDIDFELITDMLVTYGWHKVTLKTLWTTKQHQEASDWCKKHTTGQVRSRDTVFAFEDRRDAVNFTLKYGN